MEKSAVQAGFQLMDNYVSDFSLNVFEKIRMDANLGVNVNLGFAIVSINEKDLIGQIELRYDIDIINNEKEVAKIKIIMNGLFKGTGKIVLNTFKEMLKINGATTLSHLCRAYINTATALSGMPTITMPLVNFYEFFKQAKEEPYSAKKNNGQ